MDNSSRIDLGFLVLPVVAIVLFGGALRMGFLQDDFHQLTRARTPVEIDWREALSLHTGYFRPLTQRLLPAIQVSLFGYRPTGFHVVALAVFGVNACLLYALLKRFLGSGVPAFVGAFFYTTRSAHFLKLYWISAAAEAWTFLFFLFSILAFVHALRREGKAHIGFLVGSVMLYSAALASKESALLLPGLLFVIAGVTPGRAGLPEGETQVTTGGEGESNQFAFSWRRAVRSTLFHWFLLALYLALRLGLGGMGGHGLYLLSQPSRVIVNLAGYVATTADMNRELLRLVQLGEWPSLLPWFLPWAAVFLVLWIAAPVWLLLAVRKQVPFSTAASASDEPETWRCFYRRRKGSFLISLAWMAVGAAPLIVMTLGFYGYYLTIFFGGLSILVALGVEFLAGRIAVRRATSTARAAIIAFLVLLLLLSFFSVRLQETLPHSNYRRAAEVHHALRFLRLDLPDLESGTAVLFTGLTRKQYWAFGWGYCLNILYGGNEYPVYSEYEEWNTPENIPPGSFVELRWTRDRFQVIRRAELPHPVDPMVTGTRSESQPKRRSTPPMSEVP